MRDETGVQRLRGLPTDARIHLVGVAGSGMTALAEVLLARGFRLSGSDRQPSPQIQRLIDRGLTFSSVHDARHIRGVDLVIITAAIADDNVEVVAARAAGLPVVKRAVALGWVLEDRQTIAVAGTHGKTTTASLLAVVLAHAGLHPTFAVGGDVLDLGTSARWDTGPWAVVEADEYDRSFLQLHPTVAVITNVEADHLEYYGSVQAMQEAYRHFVAQVQQGGTLVLNAGDSYLRDLPVPQGVTSVWCAVEPHATQLAQCRWYAHHITMLEKETRFTIDGTTAGEAPVSVQMRLAGRHNVANALQAFAAASLIGIPPASIVAALATFHGAGRRFERRGEIQGILVVDDYAHHPTELRATLTAAKARFPGRRIVAVFQPHTYSRTRFLFDEFVAAFDAADLLVVTAIYAARETETLGMDAARLAGAIAARSGAPDVHYVRDLEDIPPTLVPLLRPGDVVLTLGAGTITRVGGTLLAALHGVAHG
jgi:UDP-N-acetylmuramate--alanine ligase